MIRYNDTITIYNKYVNTTTRLEEYQSTLIQLVNFQKGTGINSISSGSERSNLTTVFIPQNVSGSRAYIYSDLFNELTDKTANFTINENDIISLGDTTSKTIDEVIKLSSTIKVMGIDFLNGISGLEHWEVVGR